MFRKCRHSALKPQVSHLRSQASVLGVTVRAVFGAFGDRLAAALTYFEFLAAGLAEGHLGLYRPIAVRTLTFFFFRLFIHTWLLLIALFFAANAGCPA
jgi:hypothetical protein